MTPFLLYAEVACAGQQSMLSRSCTSACVFKLCMSLKGLTASLRLLCFISLVTISWYCTADLAAGLHNSQQEP